MIQLYADRGFPSLNLRRFFGGAYISKRLIKTGSILYLSTILRPDNVRILHD